MQSNQIKVKVIESDATIEARRVMNLCNACRYCEGFCAVFKAMTIRRKFESQDLDYFANLCHNCTACYHSCQYAPPHEFSVNLPKVLTELRHETYKKYAKPKWLATLFDNNGLVVTLLTVFILCLTLLFSNIAIDSNILFSQHTEPGAFYKVIGHNTLVTISGSIFVLGLVSLFAGLFNYWLSGGYKLKQMFNWYALKKAFTSAAQLRYLGGGHGEGCNTKNASYSNRRRIYHHFMMWGFLLCFAATGVATIYEYFFGWLSPFPYFSLPVVLGITGGIGLLIGPAGLVVIKTKTDPKPMSPLQYGMDYALLVLLFTISLTGLALLVFRETNYMGLLLIIHLGFVFSFFAVIPYSKFVHGFYRLAALIRYYIEQQDTHAN